MKNEIYLDITSDSYNCGGYDPEDRWSRDSYSYSWYFNGFTTQKNSSHYSLPVKDFDKSKLLFAVYVIYSTGDSFGHDENAQLELIYIGHDGELAHKIKKFIEEDYDKKRDGYDGDIYKKPSVVDGVEFWTYPWKGYFESLSYVSVESGYAK
jgi:hypothetical protein